MHFGKYFRNFCGVILFFFKYELWDVWGFQNDIKLDSMTFQSRVIAVLLLHICSWHYQYANFGEDRRRQDAWRHFLKKLSKFARPARIVNIRFLSLDFSQLFLTSKWLDVFWTSLFWCQEHSKKVENLKLTFFNENVRK